MRNTVLPPDKETQHLHEIAAEAAAKCHLQSNLAARKKFPEYLRAALAGKDIEAQFLHEQRAKAIAEEVADAFRRFGYGTKRDVETVCNLFEQESEQISYWVSRAWEVGEKIPSSSQWLELIHMCNRIFDRI